MMQSEGGGVLGSGRGWGVCVLSMRKGLRVIRFLNFFFFFFFFLFVFVL